MSETEEVFDGVFRPLIECHPQIFHVLLYTTASFAANQNKWRKCKKDVEQIDCGKLAQWLGVELADRRSRVQPPVQHPIVNVKAGSSHLSTQSGVLCRTES